MAQKTLYDVLQVSRHADPETIKAAYKSLVQRYHPDKNLNNPDAERHLKEINSAYEVLSDPVKRTRYSLLGCWELCSTEPKEEFYRLGTRVQIQITDDGWHIYCSAGLTPWGMGWDILLYTFAIDGNELILKPEKESNSPYVSSDGYEIIQPSSEQEIERIPFSVRPDGSLIEFGEVQCVYERVENLAFSLHSKKRVT